MAGSTGPGSRAISSSRTSQGHVDEPLIAGAFEVDRSVRVEGAGGGLASFAVLDHRFGRTDLMAVQVSPGAPARPVPIATLANAKIDNVLLPLAHGGGRGAGAAQACYVITARPPGPALLATGQSGAFAAWGEAELLDCLLRPAALALDQLAAAGSTHRAIRPDNLFRAGAGRPVTLGCAWAGPPASLQTAIFEPPYSAFCHQAGRGDGSIADDVYALGVVLVLLSLGQNPLERLDDAAVIRRKMDRGSYAALVGDLRVPSAIADLARGMLAEDPEHRPLPVLLADPLAARGRRVAARPPQRAQRPLQVGAIQVWDARTLGHALARSPEPGFRLLRDQSVDHWLRRTLGDSPLATRVDEALQLRAVDTAISPARADAMLMMRATAILDPLAPLCWRDTVLMPDGIGTLLAHAGGIGEEGQRLVESITSIVQLEAAASWADTRLGRVDPVDMRLDTRRQRLLLRIGGWAGGLARLCYDLNPLLPCRSQALGTDCVLGVQELLPALERQASTDFFIDQDVAGFISARFGGRMDADFAVLAQAEDPDIDPPGHRGLAQLRILARLCAAAPAEPWPRLAALCLRSTTAALAQWNSRTARTARQASLAAAAAAGSLIAMNAVMTDTQAHAEDARALQNAQADLHRIDTELARLAAGHAGRTAQARNTGQEIAAAIGVMALAATAMTVALL